MYPNPWVFDPERFVPHAGVEAQSDPRKWAFGFGRRVSGLFLCQTLQPLTLNSIGLSWSVSLFMLEDRQLNYE
jgi:hypothetical protein